MENLYKKHRQVLRTWHEYVQINRQRGLSDVDITTKLRAGKVDEEAIHLLMAPVTTSQMRRAVGKTGKWMLALGIVKIVVGTLVILASLLKLNLLIEGTVCFVLGLLWIAAYAKTNSN